MRKNSIYTSFFSNALLEMKEAGYHTIITNEEAKEYDKYCTANYQPLPPTNDLTLGYEKMIFLFIILIIGFILSLIVAMVEKMKSNKKCTTDDEEKRSKMIVGIESELRKTLEGLLEEEKKQCLNKLLEELT